MAERPFSSFGDLVLRLEKGRDYEIVVRNPGAKLTVAAIHGGGIAPLTDALAREIAGEQHNLYALRGLWPSDNEIMRIHSLRFSEMRLDGLLQRSRTALSIDGVEGEDATVQLGGANALLLSQLREHLRQTGYQVADVAFPEAACVPLHFYNRAELMGVQLNLPTALRQTMVDGPLESSHLGEVAYTDAFEHFVSTVRSAIIDYQREVGADLSLTMERFERDTLNFGANLRDTNPDHHEYVNPFDQAENDA